MSETARATKVLEALNGFFNHFLNAWAEGCAPDDAALPYITYQLVVPDALETVAMSAWVWYRDRSYGDIAGVLDDIGAAIGPGCRMGVEGGAVWLYRDDKFIQFLPAKGDGELKCARLSLRVAANVN